MSPAARPPLYNQSGKWHTTASLTHSMPYNKFINATDIMISLPNPTSQSFAEFCATADARNTIELNVRKYTLMLCDALLDNFKGKNNRRSDDYKFYIGSGRK